VLPVVPDFSHLDAPGTHPLTAPFDDDWTNVMFVGRIIPNKKFEDVIRAFHVYRTRHNPRSRLLLAGSHTGFERYLTMLHALVGAVTAVVLSFVPFSPLLGGVVAGFLEGPDSRDGTVAGGVSPGRSCGRTTRWTTS
jgi:hypothetical protein